MSPPDRCDLAYTRYAVTIRLIYPVDVTWPTLSTLSLAHYRTVTLVTVALLPTVRCDTGLYSNFTLAYLGTAVRCSTVPTVSTAQ